MHRHVIPTAVFLSALLALAGCGATGPIQTMAPPSTSEPSASPTPVPATPAPDSDGLVPEGTWQVELTSDDILGAGWSADDLPAGTYTLTVAGSHAALEMLAEDGGTAFCEAEMSLVGDGVRFDYDPAGGDCGGLEEVVGWELDVEGLLHLSLISTSSPYVDGQTAQLETEPWQRVAPSVSTVKPGMVDIGGRSLFMECRGAGSPTVVFLTGDRMPRGAMRGMEDALLEEGSVRTCDYDRAGEGRSDPAEQPQTDVDVVDDLAVLLETADIEPPYVFVGHSRGGDQTWLYADRHPEGLAGFMLLNAGFFELDWDSLHDVWSDAEIASERALSEDRQGSITQAATPEEGVPYVVMMSTIAQCGSTTDNCGRIYPVFEEWAREIASRTGSGRLVSIAAGHEIYMTQLDRVVEEIQALLDDVRSPGADGAPPDGSWQVHLTADELVAAGWPADVTGPGTYTWTFGSGRARLDVDDDSGNSVACEADIDQLASGFRLTYDDGLCGGEVDDIGWSLDESGLHLTLIETNAPVDQQRAYLETKPWQQAEPTVSPSPAAGGLTYVALGDSLLYALESECDGCTSSATLYGEQMAAELGTPVEVHNLTMHNNLNSSGLKGYLEQGAQIGRDSEDVLAAVAAADAISVTIGFNDFPELVSDPAFRLDAFRSNLDSILTRIDELRDGEPTLVAVTEIYNNGGPPFRAIVEAQNEIICDLAAQHDALCVDVYEAFNGEDGSADPISLGYLGPDDTHPSQLGMDVIAAAMTAAGYGPLG